MLSVRAVAIKEFWGLLRQPQLLLLVLAGPVLIMATFAVSFQTENIKPSAVVVVEPGSEGAELFERFRERFVSHIDFQGTVASEEVADQLIESGQVDGAIVVPQDPSEAAARNERAVIEAHYSTINPIFGLTVANRARGLLFDLNDALVQEGITQRLGDISSAREQVEEFDERLEEASATAEALNSEAGRQTTENLGATLSSLESSLEILQAAGADVPDSLEQVREARETLQRVQEAQEEEEIEEAISNLDGELDALSEQLSGTPDVSPSVLVNPFRLTLENLAPFQPEVAGFYAPGVLGLLIQHVAVSLASLALIRERMSGAYEFYEVSPLGNGHLLAGKFLTYLVLVVGVNAALVAALVGFLEVPLNGGLAPLAATMTLLATASLGVGFAISALVKSQLQAIQFAMLLFIASAFFSGFLFPLSEMVRPATGLSRVLPATYGISALRDVMIRGQAIPVFDILWLVALSALSLGAARYLMERKRRS